MAYVFIVQELKSSYAIACTISSEIMNFTSILRLEVEGNEQNTSFDCLTLGLLP